MLPLRNRAAFRAQSFDQDDEGGVFIPGVADVALGELVELEIHFLEEEVRFRIRALVRWKRARGRLSAPAGIGLTFLSSEAAARAQLLAFVDGENIRQIERDARRLPLVVEARIEFAGITHVCETDDISSSGCFLVIENAPVIDTVIKVRLKGPGLLFSWLSADAVVCWARNGGPRAGVGVRFLLENDRQKRRIDKLLTVLRARVARDVRLAPSKPPASTTTKPPSPSSSQPPLSVSLLPRK